MIRLIASDMDGTLLDDKKNMDAEIFSLIGRMAKKGIMFAAASGIERKLLPAREISEIMPFYLDNMEKYYRSCVNDCTFLHEYHLHSTMSLLAAEKHGALPPEWTGKINEILESMIPLITAPAGRGRSSASPGAQRKILLPWHRIVCAVTVFIERQKTGAVGAIHRWLPFFIHASSHAAAS